ncbi:MAG: tetratricopeptide repeat protein [Syntrophobacteraceae bacterium]
MVVQADNGAVTSLAIRPMGPRIANALAAYVEYIVKLFWPYPMVFFYPLVPVVWWQAAGAGLALLALSTFLLYRARRYPYLAVGWFWYLGTVAPVIGLVQVGGQAIADRYTYIPFIGLFIMVAWGVSEVSAGWRHRQVIAATGILSAILACVLSTWVQVDHWRNSETLFNHALQIDRNNYMAYHHLGMAMANEGKTDKAIAMYRKTLTVAPKYWPAYNKLGIICAKQGRFDEAVSLFKAAIALRPTNVDVYRNLARAYGNQGKKSEAEAVMAHVKWLIGNRGFRY